ncbi:uncharacterized protein [Triticum aestivum]|uniref:uncharacterized protein isoform X2 n=1 Tax=Triticum aestivum TaxID=4565 RepID=UPI001D02FB2D|nr:uncharacterized protein LOC123086022 isoform X2 [Triticum aestivum]
MQQAMSLPPGAVGAVSSPAGITTEQIQKVSSSTPKESLVSSCYRGCPTTTEPYKSPSGLSVYSVIHFAKRWSVVLSYLFCKQMVQPGSMQGAGHYMSQVPMFPPRTPLTPQQMQEQQHQQLQQQQAQALSFPAQVVMRPGTVNGMQQPMQAAGDLQPAAAPGGSKQDAAVAGASSEPSGTKSHKNAGAEEVGADVAEQS